MDNFIFWALIIWGSLFWLIWKSIKTWDTYQNRVIDRQAALRLARQQILAREKRGEKARIRRLKERQAFLSEEDDLLFTRYKEIADGL